MNETQVFVTWLPAEGNLDGYVVTCVSDSHVVQSNVTGELNATVDGLLTGTEYTVYVSTVKDGWTPVDSSSTLSVSTELSPGDIGTVIPSDDNLEVTLEPPSGDVDMFVVFVSNNDTRFNITLEPNETQFTIPDLVPGTEYVIILAAVKENWTTVETPPTTLKTSKC